MEMTCGLEDLLAAEREELARECSSALDGFGDGRNERGKFRVFAQLFHQHFRIGDDDSQNIVEVVGDAPGKASDGLHFLHVAESLLDAPDMRDVFGNDFIIEDDTGFISHAASADLDGNNLAVLASPMRFQLGELFSRSRLIENQGRVLALLENIGCQI